MTPAAFNKWLGAGQRLRDREDTEELRGLILAHEAWVDSAEWRRQMELFRRMLALTTDEAARVRVRPRRTFLSCVTYLHQRH